MCQSWRKRALPFFFVACVVHQCHSFYGSCFFRFPFFSFFSLFAVFCRAPSNLPQHLTYRRCLPHTRKNKNQNLNQSCLLKSGATAQSKFGVAFPDPEPHCSEPHCSQTVLWLGCPLLAFWLSFFLFFFAFV